VAARSQLTAIARAVRLRPQLLTILATALATITVAAVILSLLVWVARGMHDLPVSFGRSPIGVLGLVVSPICYAAVGGVLAARRPANPIGWLFLVMGMALGFMLPVNLMVAAAHESLRPASLLVTWLAWARNAFGTPVVLAAAVVAVQLFPSGHRIPGRWSLGVPLALLAGALLVVASGLDPVGLITYPSIANPIALPYDLRDVFALARIAAVAGIVAAAGIALGTLWKRYRDGDEILRAQLRWIVLAVALTVVAAIPFVVARYVLRVTDSFGELTAAVAQISACAFPLAAAFAISRYRLFEVDVVIGRTLVYLPMMAILGGMYTAGIALFQRVFVAVTGSESDGAIVLTILVVASVFTPLRHALESTVDRRFPAGRRPPTPEQLDPATAVATDARAPARVRLVPVAADGRVECPLGYDRTLVDCLRCPRLVATAAEPQAMVVCQLAEGETAAPPA